jgi:hypothetical protein
MQDSANTVSRLTKHDLISLIYLVVPISSEWMAKRGFCVGVPEANLSEADYMEYGEAYTTSGAIAMIFACILLS